MTLYLDMDGVLADFDGHLKSYGVDRNDKTFQHKDKSSWTPEQTRIDRIVTECMGLGGFWESIPVMEDAYDLWNYCRPFNPVILSAYPSVPEWRDRIKQEKRNWIDKYLGTSAPAIFCLRSEKKNYIDWNKPLNILVDDTPANVSEWTEVGGMGILHKSAHESIQKIDHIIREMF